MSAPYRFLGIDNRTTRIALLLLGTALAPGVQADIKCWSNKDGVRECGNMVPPEYAQQSHEVKSTSGMTIRKQDRAKTRDEVVRDREARELAARQQAAAEEAARKQAAADKVLLDTFSTEDDMLLARDGQIANLESQVKVTESHLEKLQKSMDDMIKRAADFERRSAKVPAKLAKNIKSVQEQIAENKTFIATKHQERSVLLQKFEADIARFRELRSAQR